MITWTVTTLRVEDGDPIVEFWYVKGDKPRDAARVVLEELGVYDGHTVVAVHAGTCANHCGAVQFLNGAIHYMEPDHAVWLPKE